MISLSEKSVKLLTENKVTRYCLDYALGEILL